jgi:hypothetical protein
LNPHLILPPGPIFGLPGGPLSWGGFRARHSADANALAVVGQERDTGRDHRLADCLDALRSGRRSMLSRLIDAGAHPSPLSVKSTLDNLVRPVT